MRRLTSLVAAAGLAALLPACGNERQRRPLLRSLRVERPARRDRR